MHLTKKNYAAIGVILIIVIIAVIVIVKFLSPDSAKRQNIRPIIVIGNMTKGAIEQSDSFTGDILPTQQANIYPKVGGNIEKNFADIGQSVIAGQVLSLIDTTIYSQNGKQARANLLQVSANCQNQQLIYQRNKKLFDQKLIAQQDVDNAKAAYDIALAQKEAAQAAYNNAMTQLSYCKITAPFTGTITKRYFDPGSYVSGGTTSQSSVLFVLMDLSRLKISVNIPERSVITLPNVKEVRVTADAVPDKVFTGRISKKSQAIDLSTRTMAVEIEIENSGGLLKPGMFATVQLVTNKKTEANIIPANVMLNDNNGNFVFVLNPDTTVTKKYINPGIKMSDKVEVISGLDENDKIVVTGQTLINDKMKVKLAK